MSVPVVTVEIAFSTQPNDPSPAWVDVTSYTRNVTDNISITRGRQDRYDVVQPSKLGLTLINKDGRFTPGNVSSPYYPNVKKGRKVRISIKAHWWVSGPLNLAGWTAPDYFNIPVARLNIGDRFLYPTSHDKFTWDGSTWNYDGTAGTDGTAGAVIAAATYYRFTGYVDEWPVVWADASATLADSHVSASSRMSLLGRQAQLPSIVTVEYQKDSPAAYYPLSDGAGSPGAGNIAATVQPVMTITSHGGGSSANVTFGATPGSLMDTLTAVQFTPASSSSGAYFEANINGIVSTLSTGVDAVISPSASRDMGIIQLDYGRSWLLLGIDSSGHLTSTLSSSSLGSTTITSTAVVTDGKPHHVSAAVLSGGVFQQSVDGTIDGGASIAAVMWTFTRMVIGGGVLDSTFAGTIAHAAAYAGAFNAFLHGNAAVTGFSGERSDQRIYRLSQYAGVPSSEVSTEVGLTTSVTNQDTTGQIPLTLMQDIAATEDGVLFDATDGTLKFHARSHRYNAASVLTLRAGGQDLQPSFEPRLNDQDLVNDVTGSRPGGVSVHVADPASVSDYGVYHDDLALLTTSDNEVFDAASWKVYVNSTPQLNVAVAEVELSALSSAQVTAVLAREIGDRITLSNLPSQAPATSMDFFIEGVTETIADASHRVSFNLSNAGQSGVWQLDSSVYSALNTGTRLAY